SLEIVINNMNDTPSLLKNLGQKKNWIVLKFLGTKSNRDAIGTRATVMTGTKKQVDEVRSGGSYLSQNDLRVHFGLGEAAKVDRIEVSWHSGLREYFEDVKANQVCVVEEGKGIKTSTSLGPH